MIEGYCDEMFYANVYKGTAIMAETFPETLLHASLSIAGACMYRIGDLSEHPEFTQKQVKLATCAQADYEHQYGTLDVIGSYSIGDVSVSSNAQKDALENHYKICKSAISYLMPTGLLDRRLR